MSVGREGGCVSVGSEGGCVGVKGWESVGGEGVSKGGKGVRFVDRRGHTGCLC